MSTVHLEPAASIIDAFGGLSATAEAAETTTTTVQRWRRPKSKGGTGGYIPRWHHEKLIARAQAMGWVLNPGAFYDVSLLRSPAAA
jgi:hypothetical protein